MQLAMMVARIMYSNGVGQLRRFHFRSADIITNTEETGTWRPQRKRPFQMVDHLHPFILTSIFTGSEPIETLRAAGDYVFDDRQSREAENTKHNKRL